ncbi:Tyrosine-protein phosphatase [Penicillium rolfsii]|nr:Tyrosine-protein phosphatase [Penicillium rolfsii]
MIDSDNLHDVLNTSLVTPIPEQTVAKIISLPPFISVSGVSNFRDLSYENNLRPGYVYRSANLSDITEEGKMMLAADLGITTIFDLRNEGERAKAPPPYIEGIDSNWLPYGARPASLNLRDFAEEDRGAHGFVKMYMGILEACVPAFTQVFKHIRDQPDDPFVFHCSAGKDRTGVLAALILLLMGRPHDEIINDYILTRAGLEDVRENLSQALALDEGTDHLSPEAIGMVELSGVRAQSMAAFLKTFHSTYGSGAEEYLTTKLGFSHDDVKLMYKNLAA